MVRAARVARIALFIVIEARSCGMLESQVEHWILSHAGAELPLALELPSGRRIEMGPNPTVTMRLKSMAAVRTLLNPTIGNVGTAYVEGDIDIEGSIDDALAVGVRLSEATGGDGFTKPEASLLARVLSHSRARDKEKIEYHYDVSNEFYQLFLDREMVYSCGYFKRDGNSLEQAQLDKLDHILDKVRLTAGDRLLDVGCGWGALIIRAAQRGAHAVGVTLSDNQFALAKERIAALGLEDRCEVRLQDYRDVPEVGGYDKLTSVGMFEHVGMKNLPLYFEHMRKLLKDGGAMLMHGICATHPERRQVGRGAGEFIDKYVFPDGELPHLSDVARFMAETGLEVVDVESLRRHYALTLAHWAHRLDEHPDEARRIAGEKRYRIWRAYLMGCSVGFRDNWMNIYQLLACKLGGPGMDPFPMTREWMYNRGEPVEGPAPSAGSTPS
jgi:cyclopropane-fatty-acyl-phospholipid synthase